MENTGIQYCIDSHVRGASRKFRLSLPALLFDIWPCIPDVMFWLYLFYQYHYYHAQTKKNMIKITIFQGHTGV